MNIAQAPIVLTGMENASLVLGPEVYGRRSMYAQMERNNNRFSYRAQSLRYGGNSRRALHYCRRGVAVRVPLRDGDAPIFVGPQNDHVRPDHRGPETAVR